jgi:phosphate transport system substrate-binding protein
VTCSKASRLASVLMFLWLLPSACSAPERAAANKIPDGGLLVRGAGATFPSLLYKKWFSEYQSAHPQTEITYDAVGSGEGVRRFVGKSTSNEDERVDFGASDAAMTDQEIAEVPRGALMIPATAGSVVLTYNLPELNGDLKLSREAYAGIFLGEIKNWNDPRIARSNPGLSLPKLTIVPVVRQDASGTTYAFTRHLDAINPVWSSRHGAATLIDWQGNVMRAPGNEGVASRVEHSTGSIGYVGYEFARRLGLKTAILENKSGKFIEPNEHSTTDALTGVELPENLRLFVPDPPAADAYPIVTFSWVLLYANYEDARKGEMLRNLFSWCLQDGQTYSPQLGYVRLTPDIASKALAALNTINAR